MTTQSSNAGCKPCLDESRLPGAFVVHLSGGCCGCAEPGGTSSCGSCTENGGCATCSALNQSVVVRRSALSSLCYVHEFKKEDFASGKIPCSVASLALKLTKNDVAGQTWYSACVVLSFKTGSNILPVAWYRTKINDCCNIGLLRLHAANSQCVWPKSIEINGVPTPDYSPPCPEWVRGHPDDLNDAPYWPAMDVPLMQDSADVGVRYFNGELQLRIKDVGSDSFGIPWGHTRIYSNRLSNSFNFGNGTNWLIHEWPQLVRSKTDPATIRKLHWTVQLNPTGCTIVMLRGTRNAIWFDEFESSTSDRTEWRARFGAKHTLEYNAKKKNLRVVTANGHKWEFYAFSRPCHTPPSSAQAHDQRLDGKLIRHVDPGGHPIRAKYENGRLQRFERAGGGVDETFVYEYFSAGDNNGLLRYITWTRGKPLLRVEYTYYGKDEPFGSCGDLKTAVTAYNTPTGWRARNDCVHYYRYEKPSQVDLAQTTVNDTYCQGMLRYVIGPEAFHRIKLEGLDPCTIPNHKIERFADIKVEYHGGQDPFLARRVRSISLFGNSRQHSFEYERKEPTVGVSLVGYDLWHSTTTELRPDNTRKLVTTNFVGQTLRHDLVDGADRWTHAFEYHEDHAGLVRQLFPSAVNDSGATPKFDAKTSHPPFHNTSGRVRRFVYRTPGNRSLAGYLWAISESEGVTNNKLSKLHTFLYDEISKRYMVYALRQETRHGIAVDIKDVASDGVTTFANSFQFGDSDPTPRDQDVDDGLALLKTRITVLPKVDPAFPNASDYLPQGISRLVTQKYDSYGNIEEVIDQRGTVTKSTVDVAKGVPTREVIKYRDRHGDKQTLLIRYRSDDFGRITEVLGPPHKATITVGEPEQVVCAATWYRYKVFSGEVWTAQGYALGAHVDEHTPRICIDPIAIKRFDLANRVVDEIVAVRRNSAPPSTNEKIAQDKWTRWTHQEYDTRHTTVVNKVYHRIPSPSPGGKESYGTDGEHFHTTTTKSRIGSRTKSVTVSNGTHYETVFNGRGLPTFIRMGCSEESLREVAQANYDGQKSGKNGNLTELIRYVGDSGPSRVTSFEYDYRDRQSKLIEADGTFVSYEYNNFHSIHRMRRETEQQQPSPTNASSTPSLSSAGPARRLAEQAQCIDGRGRVYEKQLTGFRYAASEQAYEPLSERYLYDDANQIVAYEPRGRTGGRDAANAMMPFVSIAYDGLGRESVRRSLLVAARREAYEQTETFRNEVGDPVLVTTLRAFPDNAIVGPRTEWLGDAKGRNWQGNAGFTPSLVSTTGNWFDPLGRMVATSDFGSAVFGANRPASIDRESYPTTIHEYDDNGEVGAIEDPLKHISRFGYDHAGRCVAFADNMDGNQFQQLVGQTAGPPGLLSLANDATYSQLGYTAERRLTQTLSHNTDTGPQTSKVAFGATTAAPEKEPPSAHLPREIVDGQGRKVSVEYNQLGEIRSKTDANKTVHTYEYDKQGRLHVDRISSCIEQRIDTRVRRIVYGYDEFGRLTTIQSYDTKEDGGTLLNTVIRKYGHYNELIVEAQLHTPNEAAGGGGLANDKDVFHGQESRIDPTRGSAPGLIGYFYLYPTPGLNDLRLATTWYPGDGNKHKKGRYLSNLRDRRGVALGRTIGLAENQDLPSLVEHYQFFWSTATARFDHFGQNTLYESRIDRGSSFKVRTSLSFGGTSPLSSLDVLGRERCRQWKREPISGWASSTLLENIEVAHDLNDNIRWRLNKLVSGYDELFKFNRLDRLVLQDRGVLIHDSSAPLPGGSVPPRPVKEPRVADAPPKKLHQTWRKDQAGNWRHWLRKDFLSPLRAQVRDHSTANDIVRFHTTIWPNPVYDDAGQITELPQPGTPDAAAKAVYDAWGRMMTYTDNQGVNTAFEYDGLGRRIIQRSAGVERHFYYDQAGRVISEMLQAEGKRTISREYIWDPNNLQRLVCRLRYVPGQEEPERLYALDDMLGNVTALIDQEGEVKERYLYDAQGHITYLKPDFSEKPNQVSDYAWEYFIGGLRFDRTTGFHVAGTGYYHADLGRALPGGAIPVLPESALNEYAEDFPFGNVRSPGIMGRQSAERFFKWVGEQPAWLKFTIGAAALTITVGVLVLGAVSGQPWLLFSAIGAACGALQGGIGAGLNGGDYGDIMLGTGLGAAFGAVCPVGGISSLAGSAVGISIAAGLYGTDGPTLAAGWDWGGLIGGVAGSAAQGTLTAARTGVQRPLLSGLMGVGPDLLGGGAGAYIGYNASGGDLNTAYHGATMGMMVGNLSGAAARGLSGVRRATMSDPGEGGFGVLGFTERYFALSPTERYTLSQEILQTAKSRVFLRKLFGNDRAARRQFFKLLRQADVVGASQVTGGGAGLLRLPGESAYKLRIAITTASHAYGIPRPYIIEHELAHFAREASVLTHGRHPMWFLETQSLFQQERRTWMYPYNILVGLREEVLVSKLLHH